jgi:hypothetical protein
MPVSPELYSKAKDLKETLYLSLRTVASGYVIMPDDYNVPYQIMRSLLLSVGQPIPIPDRVIRQGDYVYGQHVNDLKTICYALWNYINTALREPYINDSDFYPLRSLLDTIPLLMYGYLVTPKEWNAIFDYCRRMIDLILRYPPIRINWFTVGAYVASTDPDYPLRSKTMQKSCVHEYGKGEIVTELKLKWRYYCGDWLASSVNADIDNDGEVETITGDKDRLRVLY